jgi:hypothetical protein
MTSIQYKLINDILGIILINYLFDTNTKNIRMFTIRYILMITQWIAIQIIWVKS